MKANEAKEAKELPKMVTRHELAEYFQVSERTIRNYEKRGKLMAVGVGRKRYYLKSEVAKLLTSK